MEKKQPLCKSGLIGMLSKEEKDKLNSVNIISMVT